MAASISGATGSLAKLKHSALIFERWFLLVFGTLGVWQLYRALSPARHIYVAFALAGLASVFTAYVNARMLLPFTGVLLVPAGVGTVWAWDRIRISSGRPRGRATA